MRIEERLPKVKESGIRDFRIDDHLIAEYGYTGGCGRCEAMKNNEPYKTKRHNDKCRARIATGIEKSEKWCFEGRRLNGHNA